MSNIPQDVIDDAKAAGFYVRCNNDGNYVSIHPCDEDEYIDRELIKFAELQRARHEAGRGEAVGEIRDGVHGDAYMFRTDLPPKTKLYTAQADQADQAAEIERLKALIGGDVSEWLKEDETVIQRLEREHGEVVDMLGLLAKDKAEIEKLRERLFYRMEDIANENIRANSLEDNNNDLRGILTKVRDRFFPANQSEDARDLMWDEVNESITKIPPQSLAKHDNEVLERAAKYLYDEGYFQASNKIRALKTGE